MKKWLKTLAQFGPQILLFTPLAPIAPAVTVAIHEAELLKGATGAEKKAHVLNIVTAAASGANAQAGKEVVDAAQVAATASQAIDTIVSVVNTIHDATKPSL